MNEEQADRLIKLLGLLVLQKSGVIDMKEYAYELAFHEDYDPKELESGVDLLNMIEGLMKP